MGGIATLDQLIEHAALVAKGEADWVDVELLPGCATISIKVDGYGWDKHIDARGAKFIVELQDRFDNIFDSLSGGKLKAPLVKVELRDGSNELLAILESLLTVGINNMNSQEIGHLIKFTVLSGCGLYVFGKLTGAIFDVVKHKITTAAELKIKEKEIEAGRERDAVVKETAVALTAEQTKQVEALTQAITAAPGKQLEDQLKALEQTRMLSEAVAKLEAALPEDIPKESYYSAPIRNYAGALPAGDTISIAGTPSVPVKAARHALKTRRRPRSRVRWVPCDQAYICTGINLEQKDPRLPLELDEVPILATIGRLTTEERTSLITRIDERVEKREMPFRINLQVNVYYTDTGIKHSTVVGIGDPRPGLEQHRLADIPGKVRKYYDEFTSPEDTIKE